MNGLTNWVRFLDDGLLLTEAPLCELLTDIMLPEVLLEEPSA